MKTTIARALAVLLLVMAGCQQEQQAGILVVVVEPDFAGDSSGGPSDEAEGSTTGDMEDEPPGSSTTTGDGDEESTTGGESTSEDTTGVDTTSGIEASTGGDEESSTGAPTLGPGECWDGGVPRPIAHPSYGDLVITEWMATSHVTYGDWFEVHALAAFDLNGLELGRSHAVTGVYQVKEVVEAEDCIPVEAGTWIVFAQDDDFTQNGGLPVVHVVFSAFGLNGGQSDLGIGVGGAVLDQVWWGTDQFGDDPPPVQGVAQQVATWAQNGPPTSNDGPLSRCSALVPYGPGGLGSPGTGASAC